MKKIIIGLCVIIAIQAKIVYRSFRTIYKSLNM